MQTPLRILNRAGSPSLAYAYTPGASPGVLFLPGFRSDMTGGKARHLEAHCVAQGRAYCRFDYAGHGASEGRFEDGSIGDWSRDALHMVDHVLPGPLVLVGSSMGGWIMLLVAQARPERIAGLVGVAAAPDFTVDLIEPGLSEAERSELERSGVVRLPSAYGSPTPITRHLLVESARHLVLRRPLPIRCPVHLLHGQEDPDVPWSTSLRLAACLESPAVTVELIKDGDHRLSREEDLRRIASALDRIVAQAEAYRRP